MITLDGIPKSKSHGAREFEFTGLSTDEKPVGTYKKFKIANGSTFFEMDTKELKFYDEEHKEWR
jgi:hypothetical protein